MPRGIARDRDRTAGDPVCERRGPLRPAKRRVLLRAGAARTAVPLVHRRGRGTRGPAWRAHVGGMAARALGPPRPEAADRRRQPAGDPFLPRALSPGAVRRRHRGRRAQPRPRPCREATAIGRSQRPAFSWCWRRPRSPLGSGCSGQKRCPSPTPRRCRHERRPRHRVLHPDGARDPRRSRPDHRFRSCPAVAGQLATDDHRAADVRPDPVLPDAGAALLHARRQSHDGRQARQGAAGLCDRIDGSLPRRPIVHDRGGLGRVRRRLRQRRRQRQRARLDPDPMAAQAGLSGWALCRQQRDLRGDRHPDPAVDPDDPLRPGQRRKRRRPVHRGRASRAS